MSRYNLSTLAGKFWAYWMFVFQDHAFLRLSFQNAHWITEELVRTNQPWPYQFKWWRNRGIRTVINLRGDVHNSHFPIEQDTCRRLGLTMEHFPIYSRHPPTAEQIKAAKALFERVEYPVLMHCKSGADRAGMMSVLYMHFKRGLPLREAAKQLSKGFGHFREGTTGVMDYILDRYFAEAEPKGLTFLEWVESPAYDPETIKADFKAQWWGTLLTDRILHRE